MSTRFSSIKPRATRGLVDFNASKREPTFSQFQLTRTARMESVNSDVQSKRDKEISDLMEKIRETETKIKEAESILVSEERDYINEKETILTEIQQIQFDYESRSAESHAAHLEEMEALQQEHRESLQKFTEALCQLKLPPNQPDEQKEEIKQIKSRMKASERKFNESQYGQKFEDENDPHEALYQDRIRELEEQKAIILHELDDEEIMFRNRVLEMETILKETEDRCKADIDAIMQDMQRKNDRYNSEIDKLMKELEKTTNQRIAAAEKKKERTAALQKQIDDLDKDFKARFIQAARVAERLKTSLLNLNAQKGQQLEIERKRSEEHHQLLQETFVLQQRAKELQTELAKARTESAALRKELSAKLGPRRTASLFNRN